MGKGLIPVAPKTVYEAISNPRTRCIYDEMLKVGIDSNLNTYKIRLILVCQVKIIVLDKPVIKCDQPNIRRVPCFDSVSLVFALKYAPLL